jgi:outer membrane PBP1 activator LpoA protein
MFNPRTLSTVILAAALVLACESVPQRSQTSDAEATRIALAHIQAGEYLPAAQEYLRLAGAAGGDTALAYRLDAASAFVLAKRPEAAVKILDSIRGQRLSRDLQIRETLVQAQLALLEQQPERALTLLGAKPADDVPPELAARYHNLRADALEAAGEHIKSARERVELELLLTDSAALSENRRRVWESLTRLSPQALEAAHLPPPSTLGGWIELAAIGNSTITDPNSLGQAIALWRHRYPGHPAGENVVPMLVEDSYIAWAPARSVALLLPFDGKFAKAADAVRDGFMAAWFTDPDAETRPKVLVRDTSSGDIRVIYNKAIEDGADFVVGPLRRGAVSRLADAPGMPVPTLALNYADPAPKAAGPATNEETTQSTNPQDSNAATANSLYQFALSPESEARLVAEFAWFAGHTNAAVLVPGGAWGERVATAFANAWSVLGGNVIEVQNYLNDGSDMSSAVKKLLNIDESDARYRSLRRVLGGDVEKEVRRRQDVDFVFMAAFPRQARQLRPQLEFHRAQDLPVYSTSHVYSGIADPDADRDINGVVFGDMPWVLDPASSGAQLRREVGALWSNSINAFVRLYAFGADAYYLVKGLARLRGQHYAELDGVTGKLSLNENNRIDRRLVWAQFHRGTPRVLDDDAKPIQQ